MPRKPSNPDTPASKPGPLVSVTPVDQRAALALAGGFKRMQPAQYEARAALALEARENPSINLSMLSGHQLAQLAGDPNVVQWVNTDPEFKQWLVSGRADEIKVSALFRQIADEIQQRFLMFSDKDLINAWKLVAEIADKMPKRQGETVILDSKVATMDDAGKIELLVDALKKLGYGVTAPSSSGIVDAELSSSDEDRNV